MDRENKYYHLLAKHRLLLTRSLSVIVLVWIAVQIHTKVQSMDWGVPIDVKVWDFFLTIIAVLVLMIVNWGLETRKWYLLVLRWKTISMKEAFGDVMRGTALGLVTPANIGDYGGRLIRYPKEEIKRGLLANLISSLIQNSIHLSVGGIAFLCWISYTTVAQTWISIITNIVGLGLLWLLIGRYANSIFRTQLSSILSIKVYVLALFRYMIFVFQYVLLLNSLAVSLPFTSKVLGVALIYGIQSGLPLPGWLDVLARGEIALWVWGEHGVQAISVLIATYLLWFINKVVPATIGSILIWKEE